MQAGGKRAAPAHGIGTHPGFSLGSAQITRYRALSRPRAGLLAGSRHGAEGTGTIGACGGDAEGSRAQLPAPGQDYATRSQESACEGGGTYRLGH